MQTTETPHSDSRYLGVVEGQHPGNVRAARLMLEIPLVDRPAVYSDANRQHLAIGGRWSDAVASAVRAYREGRLSSSEVVR